MRALTWRRSGDFLHPAAFRPAERPIGARFIELNDLALSRFSKQECRRIGVHTCLGSDGDLTHSADVDYAELLPRLFELQVGIFTSRLLKNRIARA